MMPRFLSERGSKQYDGEFREIAKLKRLVQGQFAILTLVPECSPIRESKVLFSARGAIGEDQVGLLTLPENTCFD